MFKYRKRTLLREVIVVAAALLFLLPFWLLICIAFRPAADVYTTSPLLLTWPLDLSGFATAWSGGSSAVTLGGAMVNSLLIAVGSLIPLIVLGSMCAFTLARITARWSTWGFVLVVVGLVLPQQLGMIPIFSVLRAMGLLGTIPGMILMYTGLLMPFTVFLYSGFVRSIPIEYEEAAQLDGASSWRTYWRVVFPLLSPATGTVLVMAFLILWNDFFAPLVMLGGTEQATLPVVLYGFVGSVVSQWNVIFAAVIVSMIPVLIVFVFAQRHMIRGFAGGLKS